uniref:Uncharacterized protein n=1 Tax=Arundo donax TaxID=35708 RepID=A0A0A9CZX6_ARUDO
MSFRSSSSVGAALRGLERKRCRSNKYGMSSEVTNVYAVPVLPCRATRPTL